MRIGFVGLGRMGGNMGRRLVRDGHEVVAFNRTPEKTREIMTEGAEGAFSLEELVAGLAAPRAVWIMVPAGDATEAAIAELMELLSPGDTIIDGGNTNFHDDVRRHAKVAAKGLRYVDAADRTTERTVEPWQLVTGDEHSYLQAWCHSAGGERLFRLDRVLAAQEGPGALKVKPQEIRPDRAGRALGRGQLRREPGGRRQRRRVEVCRKRHRRRSPMTAASHLSERSTQAFAGYLQGGIFSALQASLTFSTVAIVF
mgnify:CR=1 FL=1